MTPPKTPYGKYHPKPHMANTTQNPIWQIPVVKLDDNSVLMKRYNFVSYYLWIVSYSYELMKCQYWRLGLFADLEDVTCSKISGMHLYRIKSVPISLPQLRWCKMAWDLHVQPLICMLIACSNLWNMFSKVNKDNEFFLIKL